MSVSSRSVPLLPPAATSGAMSAQTMDEVTACGESRISNLESLEKKWAWERLFKNESRAEVQKYRDEMKDKMPVAAPFEPQKFGDQNCVDKLSDSLLESSIVSIALFNGNVMIYACSGTAVRHWHRNIRGHHRIFVTSDRLAHKFEENRTRDDNLRIEVRTSDNEIMHGLLGLYDEAFGIATVTSFCLECVYTIDTAVTTDLSLNRELIAFGCATSGTLMGAKCSHPDTTDTTDTLMGASSHPATTDEFLELDCEITESGLGGPVISFGPPNGSEHILGLIVKSCEGKITLVRTKKLHEWLQRLLLITSKTSHFRRYSLPKGVRTVIPSGFMVESKILQYLGYPMPPPLLFALNAEIAGRFEEYFGQLHYWEGFPFDYYYGPKDIWDQLGERLVQKISQSVVSVASFKDNKRCFACTGLLITGKSDCPLVLTSASLFRPVATGKIDGKLKIEVFLPPNHSVEGVLELYHQNYNIAIVRLKHGFNTAICPQDLLNDGESRNKKSVVAIGRVTKRHHGLLMASMGEVKGKYKTGKNKPSTSVAKKIDCKELRLSTCQIKKVGIGGPLICMDGSFMGMNFYDESATTPFLPRMEILTVLREAYNLLESDLVSRPINMEDIRVQLSSKRPRTTRKTKTNRWPVSKPYWCLPGQASVLDQLVGKVLM